MKSYIMLFSLFLAYYGTNNYFLPIINLFTNFYNHYTNAGSLIEYNCTPPHIIFILADDLGFNDVGYHGSAEIPTPNIDALAYSGVILNRYYVNILCTPSRSALMTGVYPAHSGMQHGVIYGAEPRGLPLSYRLLPQYLKQLGYVNRMVGKWHLGSYRQVYTPMYRGFDSFLGFWTSHQDYYDHTNAEKGYWGLDMRRNFDVAYDLHGNYTTDIFTNESVHIIQNHNTTKPLFLYVAHAAVHTGNWYNPLPVSNEEEEKFKYITDLKRRKYAGMVHKLDDSVGQITDALHKKGMLNNSIIIFSTDNGGAPGNVTASAASNFPLRGGKNTLLEGGVRGVAFIWSTLIQKPARVARQLMHIVDWLPTLVDAGCGDSSTLKGLDAISAWEAISTDNALFRFEILHNIDSIINMAALTVNQWKVVLGTKYNGRRDKWFGPSGRDYDYDYDAIENSLSGRILKSMNRLPTISKMKYLRGTAIVACDRHYINETKCDLTKKPCLFDLSVDPCELDNQAERNPDTLNALLEKLEIYNKSVVPPGNKPILEKGKPQYWGYIYNNFGDFNNTLDEYFIRYSDSIIRNVTVYFLLPVLLLLLFSLQVAMWHQRLLNSLFAMP